MSEGALRPLRDEFDRVAGSGRRIDVWWRDDDAVRDGPALDRLLRTADRFAFPIALAVIPARVEPSLVDRLRDADDASVLVHGLSHANHAAAGGKPAEFGPDRPRAALARDAAAGLDRTLAAFPERALPVFVPPWNRIDPGFAETLPGLGFRALSGFGQANAGIGAAAGRIDTHLDPVDWRGGRSLVSVDILGLALLRALSGGGDRVGLLTHHLVHDEPLWSFVEGFAELVASHPATRPTSIARLMPADRPSSRRQGRRAIGARQLAGAEGAR